MIIFCDIFTSTIWEHGTKFLYIVYIYIIVYNILFFIELLYSQMILRNKIYSSFSCYNSRPHKGRGLWPVVFLTLLMLTLLPFTQMSWTFILRISNIFPLLTKSNGLEIWLCEKGNFTDIICFSGRGKVRSLRNWVDDFIFENEFREVIVFLKVNDIQSMLHIKT